MSNLTCPTCGGDLIVKRSGTRQYGTTSSLGGKLPEHGIKTTAECAGCQQLWDRDHGDQGPWRESLLS